ncbi:MAG: hypothetical protein WDM86_22270 [Rhizomicrobium sp.]
MTIDDFDDDERDAIWAEYAKFQGEQQTDGVANAHVQLYRRAAAGNAQAAIICLMLNNPLSPLAKFLTSDRATN